jgi:uncharacterized protein (TIGR01244 family)
MAIIRSPQFMTFAGVLFAALRILPMMAGLMASAITSSIYAAENAPENLVAWRPHLSSSAQPDAAFLKNAKALGYDMVINLAPPEYDTAVEAEGALLAKAGVVYLNIPVAWGNPTHEDFALFSQVLKAAGQRKVLVHCQVNLRGSSFTFLYRVIHEGAPVNDSLAKLTGIWAPNPTWKKFIESELAANGRKIELF